MYCPAGQEVTAAAKPVSVVALHALVTYCVVFGVVQAVHKLWLLATNVKLPAAHVPHTPLLPPPTLTLP